MCLQHDTKITVISMCKIIGSYPFVYIEWAGPILQSSFPCLVQSSPKYVKMLFLPFKGFLIKFLSRAKPDIIKDNKSFIR